MALEWIIAAPEISGRTVNLKLAVFNGKVYGVGFDSRLLEYNGTNSWVVKSQDLSGSPALSTLAVHNSKLYTVQSDFPPTTGFLWEWDDVSLWVQKTTTQVSTFDTWKSLVSFNGKLYTGVDILYESTALGEWVSVAPAAASPDPRFKSMIVFDGKLYMGSNRGELFEWNGSNAWVIKAPTLIVPDRIAVLLVLGSDLYCITDDVGKLLKWNGSNVWDLQNTSGTDILVLDGVVHNNEIHCSGGSFGAVNDLFKFVGFSWVKVHDGIDEVENIESLLSFNNQIFGGGVNFGGGG